MIQVLYKIVLLQTSDIPTTQKIRFALNGYCLIKHTRCKNDFL